jgi:hypothetical protein
VGKKVEAEKGEHGQFAWVYSNTHGRVLTGDGKRITERPYAFPCMRAIIEQKFQFVKGKLAKKQVLPMSTVYTVSPHRGDQAVCHLQPLFLQRIDS